MIKTIVISGLCFFSCYLSNAQLTQSFSLGMSTGYNQLYFVDNAFSPVPITDQAHYSSFLFQRTNKLHTWNMELGYAYGRLQAPFRFTHIARWQVDYWRTFSDQHPWTISGGFSLAGLFQFRLVRPYALINVGTLYDNTLGIGPSIKINYAIENKDRMSFQLRLPLLNFYTERPYQVIDNYVIDGVNFPAVWPLMKARLLGDVFYMNIQTAYHVPLYNRGKISLIYRWEYNHYKEIPINQFRGAHHLFMVAYEYTFPTKEKG